MLKMNFSRIFINAEAFCEPLQISPTRTHPPSLQPTQSTRPHVLTPCF